MSLSTKHNRMAFSTRRLVEISLSSFDNYGGVVRTTPPKTEADSYCRIIVQVVPRQSATTGLAKENQVPVPRDHGSICRIGNEDDIVYQTILALCRENAQSVAERGNFHSSQRRRQLLTRRADLEGDEDGFLKFLRASFINDAPAIMSKRVPGTCEWILSDREFQQWYLAEDSGILWLLGNAGCGKTALMSFLVEQLEGRIATAMKNSSMRKLPVLVCSYFCDDKDTDRKSATTMLRSILYQVFNRRHDLIHHAEPHFRIVGFINSLSLGLLWQILEAVMKDPTTGYICILIDAMDECEEKGRLPVLDNLRAYMDKKHNSTTSITKIMVSSRPLVQITDRINPQCQILSLGEKGRQSDLTRDVELLIRNRIPQITLQTRASRETMAFLEKKLSENANGTFLWVILVLEHLSDSLRSSRSELERKVQEIPPDLDSLYEKIVADIAAKEDPKFVVRALQIIVGAFRPLSIEEFRYAIELEPDHRTLHYVMEDSESNLDRTLRGIFKSLVSIHESRVHLVHQSAKDFLIRRYSKESDNCIFLLSKEAINNTLSMSCITFLSLTDFTETMFFNEHMRGFQELPNMQEDLNSASPISGPFPSFYEYASFYWAAHFANCQNTASQRLVEAAVTLSQRNTTGLINWSEQYKRSSTGCVTLPSSLDPSLVAAYFGLGNIVDHLLRFHWSETSGWLADEAVTWAARMGHHEIVNKLLSFKPSLRDVKVEGSSPLCWASTNGHAEVVDLLLRQCATSEINLRNAGGHTPLSLAVENGHLEITRLLLRSPTIHVDIEDRSGCTPIFRTVGHKSAKLGPDLLYLLMSESRVDLKHRDHQRRTILSWAAEVGDITIVEFLLAQKGPAVEYLLNDTGDCNGRSPLSWAAYNGHIAIVERLCHSRRINAQLGSVDRKGQNAISLAADRNHADIIELLTKFDPYGVDRGDENGRTPLSCAIWAGPRNQKTIRTLLRTGRVNVNKKSARGRTPLSYAVAQGRRDLVRILVQEGGANVATVRKSDVELAEQVLLEQSRSDEELQLELRLLKREIARE